MSDDVPRGPGAAGFGDDYWAVHDARLDIMDGFGNGAAHAAYVRSSFDVVLADVRSVIDLGFGHGTLFATMLDVLQPTVAWGIDPSPRAVAQCRARLRGRAGVRLEAIDLLGWCRHPDHPSRRFDLGICTSVWQYLSEAELVEVVPVLARRLKWLYLTVPTSTELDDQAEDIPDRWAISRPVAFYRDLVRGHFDFVGGRILESRVRLDASSSPFDEDLFRF